jgi:hypothetical protein
MNSIDFILVPFALCYRRIAFAACMIGDAAEMAWWGLRNAPTMRWRWRALRDFAHTAMCSTTMIVAPKRARATTEAELARADDALAKWHKQGT